MFLLHNLKCPSRKKPKLYVRKTTKLYGQLYGLLEDRLANFRGISARASSTAWKSPPVKFKKNPKLYPLLEDGLANSRSNSDWTPSFQSSRAETLVTF